MNIIEVKNLSYSIGTKKILDNTTFTAEKITAIIGAPIFMQIINRQYKDS